MNRHPFSVHPAFLIWIFLYYAIWGCFPSPAAAQLLQRVEIPSSFNPVGSGARALGMGGAFIAVADDATAASWNPGGLIQLEKPEISIVGAWRHRIEDNEFGAYPEASGSQSTFGDELNYLSIASPFSLFDRNMVVSLNYQHLFDFAREWDFSLHQKTTDLSLNRNIHFRQNGGLSAIGLAYCVQMTPVISLGLTLNLWNDWLSSNQWEQSIREKGSGAFAGNALNYESYNRDHYTFSGINANLGFLWNITDAVAVGAVFKAPFRADLKHESRFNASIRFLEFPAADSDSAQILSDSEKLDMPMSYGIGLSWRISDQFSVSADIYRTEWDDFILTDAQGNKTSAVSGLPQNKSRVDPTHQVRIGAERLIIRPQYVIPLRAGVFYDPAPAEGSPDACYGFSLGSGFARGRAVFDVAYQYRFGRDVGASILPDWNFSQDIGEHTIYASLIVYF